MITEVFFFFFKLGKSDSTDFAMFEKIIHEGVKNNECTEIMGSKKKSKQCGFDNLNKIFLGGEFIQDVFDQLIFNPLKLKGIITIFKYKLTDLI